MCGVVGALLCLYCRSGCSGSTVASALTFHPPTPNYKLEYDEKLKKYSILISDELPEIDFKAVKGLLIETKSKTKVPILRLTCPGAKYTVIYSHGNATDCGAMFFMYAMIARELQCNVVGYDYTGYGASMDFGVQPTEKQVYKDIDAVYDWCLDSGLVTNPREQVILYGQSVGSGPTCYLASKRPIAGLVLHSPIKSGLRVLTESRIMGCCDIFPNINRITRISAPVFVIHGQKDSEVKVGHGEGLFAAAPAHCREFEPWWVPNRGHNNVLQRNEREFIRRMKGFLLHIEEFGSTAVRTTQPSAPLGTNRKALANTSSVNTTSNSISSDESGTASTNSKAVDSKQPYRSANKVSDEKDEELVPVLNIN